MTKTDQVPGTRRKGSQTRADIQEAALSLFTERGYDATSMREIAEQLGITKAALYYHFDSKEAVIRSLFTDHLRALDDLLDWAAEQPRSPALASELLGRWLTLSGQRGLKTMRFAAANHTALKSAVPPGQGGALERIDQALRCRISCVSGWLCSVCTAPCWPPRAPRRRTPTSSPPRYERRRSWSVAWCRLRKSPSSSEATPGDWDGPRTDEERGRGVAMARRMTGREVGGPRAPVG
jgi:AcrR family transcriptional regulator